MTWLNEFEENLLTLSLPGNEGANIDARKLMALVIRELMTVASKAQDVVSYTRVSDPEYINKLRDALDNLSNDAKDLLPI